MYYRSPNLSVCADVIPFFEDGEFKLFYLRDYRNIAEDGEGCPWCLLTTKDLVNYVDHGPVLLRGTKEEQDLYVFTGSVFKENDVYYIFYTGHNPHLRAKGFPEQKILLAKSKDLIHWEKDTSFVFEAPEYLEKHDFRDPFVYKDENDTYCMLLAARLKNENPTNSKGVTLKATSKDLYHWTLDKEPFYAPRAFFTHECPDLFQIGKYWYLVFSEFTDKILTTYRISESPNGPWRTPKVNTFDGHAFYAAKSTFDGKRRILFGWNPIKNQENDNDYWQWGGNIIPHEIIQDETDGTLYVKCPQEILDAYNVEVAINPESILGSAKIENNVVTFANDGLNITRIGSLANKMKITLSFTISDDTGTFGVILKDSNNYGKFYSVKLEPRMNRLGFDRLPRANGVLHTEVDCERYCPLELNKEHHMTIIVENSVLEVYIDDKYAMSARCFDDNMGHISLFSHDQTVSFKNIKTFVEGTK